LISALGSQVDVPIDDDNDRAFDIDNDGRRWGAGQKLETGRGETKKLTLLQERWEHRCPLWTIRQMKACVVQQGKAASGPAPDIAYIRCPPVCWMGLPFKDTLLSTEASRK
jgi:hypothetical protein